MPVNELNPWLLMELNEEIVEDRVDVCQFLAVLDGQDDHYYVNSSDSESFEDDSIYYREHKDTHMIVYVTPLIRLALAGKTSMRAFVDFIRKNLTIRFRKKDVYLHYNDRHIVLECKQYKLMNVFFKFARKASFYMMELKSKRFVKAMNNFRDLRHIDMPDVHWIQNAALRHLSTVFENLTDLDVDAEVFRTLLKKFHYNFLKLERLMLTGQVKQINKIVANVERFPLLKTVEIVPSYDTWDSQESIKLVFAENAFPTVTELCINFEEESEIGFVDADYDLIKRWINKFPSLTKAKILMKKHVDDYPLDGPDRYTQLHNLFKSTDFGVPLDLTFTVQGSIEDPNSSWNKAANGEDYIYYEKPFACFKYIETLRYDKFVYKDAMPGKTFEHTILMTLEP